VVQGDYLSFFVGQEPNPIWEFELTVSGTSSKKEMHGKGEGKRSGQSLGSTSVSMALQNAQ
jgi:hypothetical protein